MTMDLYQLEQYKKLKSYIDKDFKKNVKIDAIEKKVFYSYKNINRIFQKLHPETVGKYIKRVRLEKAAEYLKYSDHQVSDIAIDIGFSDVAAFSKSFKKRFKCSPNTYRENLKKKKELNLNEHLKSDLSFEIENLPKFKFLYLEHLGDIGDIVAIEKTWAILVCYCKKHKLISKKTIFFSETVDDNEITDSFNCRTQVAIVLDKELDFIPEGLFLVKTHYPQKYAKFIHKGQNEKLVETYNLIYSLWMNQFNLEFSDKPNLEFYLNHHTSTHKKNLITEIYIPIL
ncbi:MAG: AraC family transcriptional regulator [Flavobacteriales bacterium]|jgi:AraC family transcriptional regulator